MKAIFPGTASGIATKTRFHNMILLESQGHTLLLDGGEPLSTLLIRRETDLERIDGMVISHLHPDHAGSLPQLIQTLQISQRKRPFRVLMPSEGLVIYRKFLDMLYLFDRALPFPLELVGIDCAGAQKIGDFSLEFIQNRHLEALKKLAEEQGLLNTGQSYSFAVSCEGRRVVYSGDVKSALELIPLLNVPTDLLILEMAHFSPDEFRTLWEEAPPRKAVLTHFHPRLDISPEKLLQDIFMPYKDKVVFAQDGTEAVI